MSTLSHIATLTDNHSENRAACPGKTGYLPYNFNPLIRKLEKEVQYDQQNGHGCGQLFASCQPKISLLKLI